MVLSDRISMKGARVDGTTAPIGGKEFGKGGVEVIRNKRGDDILVAIRNDKKVASANGIEIVLPSWTRVYAWLRASGTGSASFCISIHCLSLQCVGFGLLVQDYSHGGNRGRGTRWDIFDKRWYNGRHVGGIGGRGDRRHN